MTDEQKRMVRTLSGCRFVPGSPDKRYVRQLEATVSLKPETTLTERQAAYLIRLVHRYRRQHKACTCLECFAEASKKDQPYQQDMFGEMK